MKPNLICLLLLLLRFTGVQAQAAPVENQKSNTRFAVERVAIIDPGKIVTDLYPLVSGDLRDSLNWQTSIDKNQIIFNGIPAGWDGKMKEPKDEANWPSIKKYTAWRIAASSEYDVLQIKAEENTGMPEGFKPTKDFYIIIEKSGVETIKGQAASKGAGNYCTLAAAMYEADKTKFETVKGKPIEAIFGKSYEANMPASGAKKIYVKELLGFYTLVAELIYYNSL
jgi:hypothetical protein